MTDTEVAHDGDIQNDWDGKHYTKAEAIDYVQNYGKPKPAASPESETR